MQCGFVLGARTWQLRQLRNIHSPQSAAPRRAAAALKAEQQLRQLRHVDRDPPRLVLREQLRRRSPPRFILKINVRELLAAMVNHDKAGVQSYEPYFGTQIAALASPNGSAAFSNNRVPNCGTSGLLPFCYPTAQYGAGQGSIKALAGAR
jgi:hypothetical protein